MAGPLSGIRIVEFAGLGPGPFCGMMLADHGAEVIRVDRPGTTPSPADPLLRSRRSVIADLKSSDDVRRLRELLKSADGLIEGFRPGVMERLGLGPDVVLMDNPALIYGRMTGWGQAGANAAMAGHDINYIALSGALAAFGRASEKPTPPINLVGDFGGGGMMLAFAMVSALLAVRMGGSGQVIDCAMTDGSALLMAAIWGFRAIGRWNGPRGTNLLDTGAPFYDTYETADGGHIAIGAIEPQFYALLRAKIDTANDPLFDDQMDESRWPAQKAKLEMIFRSKTRDAWAKLLDGTDACFSPVLDFDEAVQHVHNVARGTFITVNDVVQPAPAPRYSATVLVDPTPPSLPGADQELMGG